MYAVKIESGKERIRVRSYNNGFLPSYVSAAEESMGKRMYVVPGYVFTMTRVGGAEKIPDSDWKIIEAISDKNPSTLDVNTGKIIDGPLKDLLILRVNPALKAVLIRARLLGVTRDYWLAVRFRDGSQEEDPIPDSDSATTGAKTDTQKKKTKNNINKSTKKSIKKETKKNTTEGGKMGKDQKTYTDEQIQAAVERAKEIGIHAAGREAGMPWQVVMAAARKAGVEITPKQVNRKQEEKKKQKTSAAAEKTTKAKKTVKAEKVETTEKTEKTEKAEKTGNRRKARVKKADAATSASAPAQTTAKEETSVLISAEDALRVENAVLKAKNARLTEEVEKLKAALRNLL